MAWPDQPASDDVRLRRALDRATTAVQKNIGIGYPTEWLRPIVEGRIGGTMVKLDAIIQVAVEATLGGDDGT